MLSRTQRSTLNSLIAVVAALVLIALATPASAADKDGAKKTGDREARSAEPSETGSVAEGPAQMTSFVVYADLLSSPAGPDPARMTRPRSVASSASASASAAPPPVPAPAPAASTAPMTPGEKFQMFAKGSFFSIGAYAGSIVSGAYGEWTDDDHHHHAASHDFAADMMTRAARSFAFRANANFFEKFFFASIFKQDPRYHRSGKKGAGAKIGYAVSRLFVTQGDNNGRDQFNISFIAGALSASGMANLWERPERQDLEHFGKRFGTHLAFSAAGHILREFLGGQ